MSKRQAGPLVLLPVTFRYDKLGQFHGPDDLLTIKQDALKFRSEKTFSARGCNICPYLVSLG